LSIAQNPLSIAAIELDIILEDTDVPLQTIQLPFISNPGMFSPKVNKSGLKIPIPFLTF